MQRTKRRKRGARVKRAFDVVVSAALLILTAPVTAAVAVLVRLRLGRPVLFRQVRPGLGGAPFELVKFRTMREAFDQRGEALPDAQRLTRLGAFLRRTSLDELPELVNVLRGDMSLVGPRPLLMEYLAHYTPEQARRHEVRPGVTGLAQVEGRNLVDFERRFELDVAYVDQQSLWLDVRILGRTVTQVIRGHGITSDGHVTMPRFTGGTAGGGTPPDAPSDPRRSS